MSATPAVLVEDFFRDGHGTVTDPSAATGYPASRLRDSKDYLDWVAPSTGAVLYKVDLGLGGDLEADMFALLGSNLHVAAPDMYVQYSDNDIAYTTVASILTAGWANRSNGDVFAAFSGAGAHRYWMVYLGATASVPCSAREIYLGRRVSFPYGIDPFQGFDPRAEIPMNRVYESEQGFILETTSDFVRREMAWQFQNIPPDFWTDATQWTGFRWWWENYALRGRPGVFAWNPGVIGSTFEQDALFGVPVVQGSPNLATSVDRGYRNLSFRIKGRLSG